MRRPFAACVAITLLAACTGDRESGIEPGDPAALIAESREILDMPGVIPCVAPQGLADGQPGQPLRSGYVHGASHETPAEALKEFIDADPQNESGVGFAEWGYVEMRFPESRVYTDEKYVIYGRNYGYGWVTLIGVYQSPDGWTVTWWAGSGC